MHRWALLVNNNNKATTTTSMEEKNQSDDTRNNNEETRADGSPNRRQDVEDASHEQQHNSVGSYEDYWVHYFRAVAAAGYPVPHQHAYYYPYHQHYAQQQAVDPRYAYAAATGKPTTRDTTTKTTTTTTTTEEVREAPTRKESDDEKKPSPSHPAKQQQGTDADDKQYEPSKVTSCDVPSSREKATREVFVIDLCCSSNDDDDEETATTQERDDDHSCEQQSPTASMKHDKVDHQGRCSQQEQEAYNDMRQRHHHFSFQHRRRQTTTMDHDDDSDDCRPPFTKSGSDTLPKQQQDNVERQGSPRSDSSDDQQQQQSQPKTQQQTATVAALEEEDDEPKYPVGTPVSKNGREGIVISYSDGFYLVVFVGEYEYLSHDQLEELLRSSDHVIHNGEEKTNRDGDDKDGNRTLHPIACDSKRKYHGRASHPCALYKKKRYNHVDDKAKLDHSKSKQAKPQPQETANKPSRSTVMMDLDDEPPLRTEAATDNTRAEPRAEASGRTNEKRKNRNSHQKQHQKYSEDDMARIRGAELLRKKRPHVSQPKYSIGTVVRRPFQGSILWGCIDAVDARKGLYRVLYHNAKEEILKQASLDKLDTGDDEEEEEVTEDEDEEEIAEIPKVQEVEKKATVVRQEPHHDMIASSTSAPRQLYPVGTTIRRWFGLSFLSGTVDAVDPSNGMYRVLYQNGRTEYMTQACLELFMQQEQNQQKPKRTKKERRHRGSKPGSAKEQQERGKLPPPTRSIRDENGSASLQQVEKRSIMSLLRRQERDHNSEQFRVNTSQSSPRVSGARGRVAKKQEYPYTCVPLPKPVPIHYQGELVNDFSKSKLSKVKVPGFQDLANFKGKQVLQVSSPGMSRCAMCGNECPTKKIKSQGNDVGYIPPQNKGVCTNCDVLVWVVKGTELQIKWCKGCKNFRHWAAFGVKGLATKCMACRQRYRLSYQQGKKKGTDMMQKQDELQEACAMHVLRQDDECQEDIIGSPESATNASPTASENGERNGTVDDAEQPLDGDEDQVSAGIKRKRESSVCVPTSPSPALPLPSFKENPKKARPLEEFPDVSSKNERRSPGPIKQAGNMDQDAPMGAATKQADGSGSQTTKEKRGSKDEEVLMDTVAQQESSSTRLVDERHRQGSTQRGNVDATDNEAKPAKKSRPLIELDCQNGDEESSSSASMQPCGSLEHVKSLDTVAQQESSSGSKVSDENENPDAEQNSPDDFLVRLHSGLNRRIFMIFHWVGDGSSFIIRDESISLVVKRCFHGKY